MAAAKGKPKTTRTTAKSTSAGTSAKKNAPARSRAKKNKRQSNIPWPAIGTIVLALGVLMFFSAVFPSSAPAIVAVRRFVNGYCGVLGAIVSALVVAGGLRLILRERWPAPDWLWTKCVLLVLCIMTLLQLFRVDSLLLSLGAENLVQNYSGFLWKSYDASLNIPLGGGSLGGILAYPMKTYLDTVGSLLLLFIAMFGLAFSIVRALIPSAGEHVGGWYDQLREEIAIRKDEFIARREEKRAMQREVASLDDALLVPVPQELYEEEVQAEEPRAARRVATGKRVTRPDSAPAAKKSAPVATPKAKVVPMPRTQPAEPEPWEEDGDEVPAYIAEAPRPRAAKRVNPRAAKQPAGAQKPTAPTGKKRRLYMENDFVQVQAAPPSQEAYTEFDAEQAKYATRPSRKNAEVIPDFILKRRAQLDAEYGMEGAGAEAVEEPLADVQDEGSLPWEGEDEVEPAPFALGMEMSAEEDALAETEAESGRRITPRPLPQPSARKARSYVFQDPQDRVPELDPQERLDRPDWRPPEDEQTEQMQIDTEAYRQPPFSLLERDEKRMRLDTREADAQGAKKLEETLQSYGVTAKVIKVVHGPAITRYELQPAPGVKVSKFVSLTDDIALNMAAIGVRIEAPIPGKAAIGIEIANDEIQTVHLRDVLESDESLRNASKLAVALGKDIAGKRIIADLAKMPHLLIAGATGSGKSVCINTLITSIIYRATPEEVRLILIDPKKVELAVYDGIPHLLVPVVTDPKKASGALNWAVMEMDERYKRFAEVGVRDIKTYNARRDEETPLMPQIVVIIDELSDLMLVAPGEVEESICRIAQLARACGIHLVIATQRPSVNVITGIIKANIPSRIAFAVSSQVDSRTILDSVGAEKLLGRGDMLYAPTGGGKPLRVQGCFVSDDEVARVTEYVKNCHETDYSQAVIEALAVQEEDAQSADEPQMEDCDELFREAVEMAIESGQTSISMLQRRLRIGYARAGRIVDEMARRGYVGQADGAKPREVLITREEFNIIFAGDPGA